MNSNRMWGKVRKTSKSKEKLGKWGMVKIVRNSEEMWGTVRKCEEKWRKVRNSGEKWGIVDPKNIWWMVLSSWF